MSTQGQEPRKRSLDRGETAVCVFGATSREDFLGTLRSVEATTVAVVPVIAVVTQAAIDAAALRAVLSADRDLTVLERGDLAEVMRISAPADIAFLRAGVTLPAGWLDSLKAAAASDSQIAVASPFVDGDPRFSLNAEDVARDVRALDLEHLAQTLRSAARRDWPRIESPSEDCALVVRPALELASEFEFGDSQTGGGRSYFGEELQNVLARCAEHGLVHVLADDLVVRKKTESADMPSKLDDTGSSTGAVRARAIASAALGPLTVTVDCRCLADGLSGTQVHALELVNALAARDGLRVRMLLPDDLPEYAVPMLDRIQAHDSIRVSAVNDNVSRDLVVHRPFQLQGPDDAEVLHRLGDRLIVTQQDVIAYQSPGHFGAIDDWRRYQRLVRLGLAAADIVTFFTDHAARQATALELVEPAASRVIGIGVDHAVTAANPDPVQPEEIAGTRPLSFLLCLGNNFPHKNRLFALRLLEELRAIGWEGDLVFAGAQIAVGSSAEAEGRLIVNRSIDGVHDLGVVDDQRKSWLISNAAAVVYPTTLEGFGLVPFEAASAGVPCLFASQSALAETLPKEAATVSPWDPVATACVALPLLSKSEARSKHIGLILSAAGSFTWESTAGQFESLYREVIASPKRSSAASVRQHLEFERDAMQTELRLRDEYSKLDRAYKSIVESAGPEGLALVGPGGALPPESRLALLRLVRRRALRTPFFGLLKCANRGMELISKSARRSG